MTDRIHSLTVVLENDMRVDDAESLIQAIRHIRGVIAVSGNISEPSDYMAQQRAKNDLVSKIYDVLRQD